MAAMPLSGLGQADDLVISDFEAEDYGEWQVSGEAFGEGPAPGTLPNQMEVTGYQGERLVNSFYGGDASTGTLTSPPFEIQRPYINFLIGGGKDLQHTCIQLIIDGQAVAVATGPNDSPGGSERLDWHSWQVEPWMGQEATIQIVDQATGGWGHINIDAITQSDETKQAEPEARTLTVQETYLHLPVKTGAPMRRMKMMVDGETIREFDIEYDAQDPDFWVFSHVEPYKGLELTLHIDALPADSPGLEAVKQSPTVPKPGQLYEEAFRPQFHFTSRRGWNNDPNGLVYYDGEYHLYYQHNPYGYNWGNMHWGHAVSTDLVHWRELPIALYPQEYGDWCFSGGALVDNQNTGGFQTGKEEVIIAAYTSTGRGECIAYSNDRGRTFTEYEGNPVVEHEGRDPKIIWYEPGQHWVMAVYNQIGESQGIAFYTSDNLKSWQKQSRIDGYYECPEIFELPVDGDEDNPMWVVYAADGAYSLGGFDGKTFTAESGKHAFHYGDCFYASQTYSDIPPHDGRRIQIAWGRTGHPDMPFNQMMNFPVTLTLRDTDEGVRLFAEPIREIAELHANHAAWQNHALTQDEDAFGIETGELLHIQAVVEVGDAERITLDIRGEPVVYDAQSQRLLCQDSSAPLKPVDGKIHLEMLVDRLSLEIFGNHGRIYMPMSAILDQDNRTVAVKAQGGDANLAQMDVYTLKPIWP